MKNIMEVISDVCELFVIGFMLLIGVSLAICLIMLAAVLFKVLFGTI